MQVRATKQPVDAHHGSRLSADYRRLDIQGLRAIAVLIVVAFHAGLPIPGGFVGVDVFFVISGFVITLMLNREWSTNGRISLGLFYLRRFKRLAPALALVVTITVLISSILLSPLGPQQIALETAVGAVLLTANFVIASTTGGYFDSPAETNPLLNTWSLSVEEQFYLVFPAIVLVGWILSRRRPWLRLAPIVLVAGVIPLSFFIAVRGPMILGVASRFGLEWDLATSLFGFYSPLTRAWEFAAGALLALVLSRGFRLAPKLLSAAGWIGAWMLLASAFFIDDGTPFPGVWTLLPVTATVLLLLAGTRTKSLTTRTLASRPLVLIGDFSYSIYLWHWPLIVFAGNLWPNARWASVGAAALSFLPAYASYRWLEQPIRQTFVGDGRQLATLVAVTLFIPLLISGSISLITSRLWVPATEARLAAAAQLHAGYTLGCHYAPEQGYEDPEPCRWHASSTGQPVYLLGDSNAAHYTEGLIASTERLQRPLIVSTSAGCPLLDLPITSPSRPNLRDACSTRTERLLQWMDGQEPGTVILSGSDEYWLTSDFLVDLDGHPIREESQRVSLFQRSLERTIRRLQDAGHSVVVVQTVPHFFGKYVWDPATCNLWDSLRGCPQEMPLPTAEARSRNVKRAVHDATVKLGAIDLDVSEEICPRKTCTTWREETPIYRDANHISVAQSKALGPTFEQILINSSSGRR